MRAWLTPENTPTGLSCWRVFLPDVLEAEAIFRGLLLDLIKPRNWQQTTGISVDDCIAAFSDGVEQSLNMITCSSLGGGIMIAGIVFFFAGSTAPDGSLVCDGSILSRYDYPELYNQIGYTWGGSNELFYLPDLAGRVAVGVDTDISLGDTGGAKTVTLGIDEIPSHQHSLYPAGASGITVPVITPTGKSVTPTVMTSAVGGGNPHENMPPYAGLLPCISTGQ